MHMDAGETDDYQLQHACLKARYTAQHATVHGQCKQANSDLLKLLATPINLEGI